MIILLFGPPGCGKGTQAPFLAERLRIPAISTGEMFRAECKAGTELGRVACDVLSKGALVSDEIANRIVASRIARPDCARGFLLDGYPRTLPQAQYFTDLLRDWNLPDPVVIHLQVPETELIGRLAARRQCPNCLHIYNLQSQPPRAPGVCDVDGVELVTREDDRENVIRERLSAYQELTGPVLEWLDHRVRTGVKTIDGTLPPERVSCEIERAVRLPAYA